MSTFQCALGETDTAALLGMLASCGKLMYDTLQLKEGFKGFFTQSHPMKAEVNIINVSLQFKKLKHLAGFPVFTDVYCICLIPYP